MAVVPVDDGSCGQRFLYLNNALVVAAPEPKAQIFPGDDKGSIYQYIQLLQKLA